MRVSRIPVSICNSAGDIWNRQGTRRNTRFICYFAFHFDISDDMPMLMLTWWCDLRIAFRLPPRQAMTFTYTPPPIGLQLKSPSSSLSFWGRTLMIFLNNWYSLLSMLPIYHARQGNSLSSISHFSYFSSPPGDTSRLRNAFSCRERYQDS